jgi:hypothetical protein
MLLKGFVKPLSDLVTIATNSRSWPLAIELRPEADALWADLRHPLLDAPEPLPPAARREYQVVHYSDVRLQGLAAWLAEAPELDVIPTLVAGQVGQSGPSIEVRILVLASAAEGYHRRIYPDDRQLTPSQLEQVKPAIQTLKGTLDAPTRRAVYQAVAHVDELTFRERLLRLAEVAEETIPGLTGTTDAWTKVVAKHRNRYAHRLTVEEEEEPTDLFFEMRGVQQSLRWLLTVLLLAQAGVSGEAMATRVARNYEWGTFIEERVRHLPGVYTCPPTEATAT